MKHLLQLIVHYTTWLPCFFIGSPMSNALYDLVDAITYITIVVFKRVVQQLH